MKEERSARWGRSTGIADRDSAETSDALSMLGNGKLDEKSIEAQEQRQEGDAHLKALLGEQRFAEFGAASAAGGTEGGLQLSRSS